MTNKKHLFNDNITLARGMLDYSIDDDFVPYCISPYGNKFYAMEDAIEDTIKWLNDEYVEKENILC